MMAMERKNIRAEGIRLDKKVYWHRELVNHVGQPCIIRYDYSDARWIVVYDKNDVFICQAALRKTQHPFIEVSMDKAVSHKELNKEYNEIKSLRREKERNAKKWVVNSQKAVDALLKNSTAKQEKLEDQGAGTIFSSPPMLEAPPKDSDEIIEEMTRKAMMKLTKHPDMLSPEERENFDAEEKERLAKIETNCIIEQEIKASFDRIGLDYNDSNGEMPISMKIAFSKTAREHFKSQQTTLADQDSADQVGTTISDEPKPIAEEIDQSDATLNKTELPEENNQTPDEVEIEQSPFAHLSKAELLKRIGITN